MAAARSPAAALAALRVDWYTWYTARTEATITEASKVNIRAVESTAGSNVYEAWSSSDSRFESSTSSESTPILSTRQKNKTITREKLQSKPNSSLPRRWNGPAIDVKRRITSEKTKPMTSCTVEPGRMITQKPTRNSCGAQKWAVRKVRLRERSVGCSVRIAFRAYNSNGDDPVVLGVVAIERVINPQEAGAVIKLLAVESLEGARGDQRESEE
eukprot:scaffold7455_cov72-Phaeocystis_antarctica.AAC.5